MERSKRRSLIFLIALLLPASIHFAALLYQNYRGIDVWQSRLDWAIFGGVLFYIAASAIIAWSDKLAPRLLIFVYTLIISLLLAEAGLRMGNLLPSSRAPWPPNLRRVSTAGDAMPGITGKIELSINNIGLRGPDIDPRKDSLDILCVGGSTTECLYVTDKLSWPWRLGDMLTQHSGRNIFVGNAGRSGHSTFNHEYLLKNYSYAADFDKVILLVGVNEMGAILRQNLKERAASVPVDTLYGMDAWGVYYRQSILFNLLRLAIARSSSSVYTVFQDERGNWYEEQRKMRREAIRNGAFCKLPPDLDSYLEIYRANLESIVRLVTGRGQELILLTQPSLYDTSMPPELENLLVQNSNGTACAPATLKEMIDRYNAITLDVCRAHNLPCIDLAPMLPKDTTVFYDDVHFNIAGCEKIAKILFESLKDGYSRK